MITDTVASATCECPRDPYPDEPAALAALADGRYGPAARAYKCSRSSTWHIAGHGYELSTMRTQARLLAWHLHRHGWADTVDVSRQLGLDDSDWSATTRSHRHRVDMYLVLTVDPFVRHGWAAWTPGVPLVLRATAPAAIERVCQVGMRAALEDLGLPQPPFDGFAIRADEVRLAACARRTAS